MATKISNPKCIFGLFETRMDLELVVDNFKAQGFRSSDLSVLIPDDGEGIDSGDQFGGALGWLSDVQTLIIPKVGSFVAAGPILNYMTLSETELNLAEMLSDCGIPKDESNKYEAYIKEGAMLIAVYADDSSWMNKARLVMESGGAKDVTSAPQKFTTPRQDGPMPIEPHV